MAADTNRDNDIVLSDVHVCLTNSENIDQGLDPQTKPTWLSRFYFRLPQNCMTASQPLEKFITGSLGCRFGNYSSTAMSRTERTCGLLEKSLPQLDDDGDCVHFRKGSLGKSLPQLDEDGDCVPFRKGSLGTSLPQLDEDGDCVPFRKGSLGTSLPQLDEDGDCVPFRKGSLGKSLPQLDEDGDCVPFRKGSLGTSLPQLDEDGDCVPFRKGSLGKSLPQLDEDGDCMLLRRGSQKLFQNDSESSFQHQMIFRCQEVDHIPPVLLPVCETTTCGVEKGFPDLDVKGSRIVMRGSTENLLSNVSENSDDVNLPHEIDYNTKDLSVCDSVHGSLEKNLVELDEDGDVILKRRQANTLFQNAFQVDNDNKKVLKLPQGNYSSIDTLSTDKKSVNSTSRCDQLFNCYIDSVQRTGNKLLKSYSRIYNSDASQGANIAHREIFLEQPDTLEPNFSSSSSGDNFSVSQIKINDKIPTEEQSQNEEVIYGVLTLEHSMGTSIPEVGYQVWSGALLLCDYLIHNCTDLEKSVVLDLGTGTGITAIVAAMFAPQVLSTDYLPGVVGLAERNWERNKDLLPRRACDQVCFKILDWTRDWGSFDSESKYALTSPDLKLVEEATLILAAEAIYDDELTDGLFTTIYNLLIKPPCKSVVLTVERRIIFSVDNQDVCSPAYEHFLENLDDLVTVEEGPVCFTAKKLDADFPQFFHYQRVKELKHSRPFLPASTQLRLKMKINDLERIFASAQRLTAADKARPRNDLSSGK